MKRVKLFEQFLNENAFSNFSSEEKKAWKKAENKMGDTYFVPANQAEYEKMMQFLASKNWYFWNVDSIPGFPGHENIDPNKLPTWKDGIGFKLGGTRTGQTTVIPTMMKYSTGGGKFSYDDFSKVLEQFINEAKSYEVYHNSYSSAVDAALEYAKSMGYEIVEDDVWDQISVGPKKPSEGKTNKATIGLTKDGKPQRKALQIQIYGMGARYELNAYIN